MLMCLGKVTKQVVISPNEYSDSFDKNPQVPRLEANSLLPSCCVVAEGLPAWRRRGCRVAWAPLRGGLQGERAASATGGMSDPLNTLFRGDSWNFPVSIFLRIFRSRTEFAAFRRITRIKVAEGTRRDNCRRGSRRDRYCVPYPI